MADDNATIRIVLQSDAPSGPDSGEPGESFRQSPDTPTRPPSREPRRLPTARQEPIEPRPPRDEDQTKPAKPRAPAAPFDPYESARKQRDSEDRRRETKDAYRELFPKPIGQAADFMVPETKKTTEALGEFGEVLHKLSTALPGRVGDILGLVAVGSLAFGMNRKPPEQYGPHEFIGPTLPLEMTEFEPPPELVLPEPLPEDVARPDVVHLPATAPPTIQERLEEEAKNLPAGEVWSDKMEDILQQEGQRVRDQILAEERTPIELAGLPSDEEIEKQAEWFPDNARRQVNQPPVLPPRAMQEAKVPVMRPAMVPVKDENLEFDLTPEQPKPKIARPAPSVPIMQPATIQPRAQLPDEEWWPQENAPRAVNQPAVEPPKITPSQPPPEVTFLPAALAVEEPAVPVAPTEPAVPATPAAPTEPAAPVAPTEPPISPGEPTGGEEGIAATGQALPVVGAAVGIYIGVIKMASEGLRTFTKLFTDGLVSIADVAAPVSGDIQGFGNKIDEVGSELLYILPAFGLLLQVTGEVVAGFGKLIDAVDKTAKNYAQYSPALAQTEAMTEVGQVLNDMRRAQRVEGALSQYMRARFDIQQRYEDIKVAFMEAALPVITGILTLMTGTIDDLRPAFDRLIQMADGIPVLVELLTFIRDLLTNAQNEVPQHVPTNIILERFGAPGVQSGFGTGGVQ